jgi:mRNA interferase MazF
VVRGEVYRLKIPREHKGHEVRGAGYAVVVQADELAALSTVIVAPTSRSAPASWLRPEVEVAGEKTRVLVDAVSAFDLSRFGEVVGALRRAEMDEVDEALRLVLGLT